MNVNVSNVHVKDFQYVHVSGENVHNLTESSSALESDIASLCGYEPHPSFHSVSRP